VLIGSRCWLLRLDTVVMAMVLNSGSGRTVLLLVVLFAAACHEAHSAREHDILPGATTAATHSAHIVFLPPAQPSGTAFGHIMCRERPHLSSRKMMGTWGAARRGPPTNPMQLHMPLPAPAVSTQQQLQD
jgi:hypothetical protein